MARTTSIAICLVWVIVCAGCGEPPPAWSIAIHGGAGGLARDTPPEEVDAYREALRRALRLGADALDSGHSALDVVERVVRELEDEPLFNAGRGAVYTAAGEHELDASIMDGRTLESGAAAAVRGVRHPITLARRVMERTPHVLLVGPGAEAFARGEGLVFEPPAFFATERRRRALEDVLGRRPADGGGTVGVVARDTDGHLAAGTSTGGLTGKLPGRVGDSPLIGAGTFADDRLVAVSCTGRGELFIRHGVARRVAWLVGVGEPLDDAVRGVIHELLEPGDGGLIAVDARGRIATAHSTSAMFRGAADANGRFEVAIWD